MSDTAIAIVKREDLAPLCPHCENELNEVYVRTQGVPFVQGTNVVYFCPHCQKVLGVGHGRMI